MAAIEKGFEWDFTKAKGVEEGFAFFTRQRSDQFDACGLSGTLAKRDYKSFTDLVVTSNYIRRVTPDERLLLQGFPKNWFNDCNLTKTQEFTFNGMTVNVVKWIGECVVEFNKISDSDFFAGGYYRKVIGDTSYIIKDDGEMIESAFTIGWLKREPDYKEIKH
jgi:hypothetical protein